MVNAVNSFQEHLVNEFISFTLFIVLFNSFKPRDGVIESVKVIMDTNITLYI